MEPGGFGADEVVTNYVQVDRAGVCRAGDVTPDGHTDGPFDCIRKANIIHNIEGSHMWQSRSHARNFLGKIREELPMSCECDLLKIERVEGGNDGGKLLPLLLFSTWQLLFN